MEDIEATLETPVSAQALRIVKKYPSLTFGQLDAALMQDDKEQAAIRAIREWFVAEFDHNSYTKDQGDFAAYAMAAWYVFDPDDFEATFKD